MMANFRVRKLSLQIALLFVFLIALTGCNCVSRLAMQYKGQQVSPLYLQSILPSLANEASSDCIKWRAKTFSSKIDTIEETNIANKGKWYRSFFSDKGFIDYTVVGTHGKETCIIVRESDGTLNRAYCLFLLLNCRKVCLQRSIELKNLKDDLVRIEGNYLIIGKYRVPIEKLKISQ